MHENFPVGRLITGGLGGNACDGSFTTAMHFHLWGCEAAIVIPPPPGREGGGGSIPLLPGEIQNLYNPVQGQPEFYIPTKADPFKKPNKIIKVMVKIGDHEYEKELLMKDKPFYTVLRVSNIVNATQHKIKVNVDNIKEKFHSIMINIRNVRKKRD